MRKIAIGLCCGLLVGQAVWAGDWLEWRGPGRAGISSETGLLQAWPAAGPKLLWQIDQVGGGYSTPVVKGDRLYFLANVGMEDEYVWARSVKDGSEIWSTRVGKVGVPDQKPSYPGSRGAPTIDGELLYALGSDGDLVCLETATGKQRWHINFREAFGSEPPRWAWSESPLVDGDRLICSPGGADATILAVDKLTGETIWKTAIAEADLAGYGSPVVATISGVRQYVIFLAKGVVGVDAATGKLLWRYAKTAEGSPANILTPIIDGDRVYTGSSRGGGALVRIDLGGATPVTEIYHNQKMPTSVGGAILLDGHLYGTTRSALLSVAFATGEMQWTDRSVGPGTVGYADNRLYVMGDEGEIALVDASAGSYREVGRFTPPGRAEAGTSWTYPVVANGRMYIRHLDKMWAYDIRMQQD